MAEHKKFTVDTGVQVSFGDPTSPWQRGTDENTNGCSVSTCRTGMNLEEQLDKIAHRLNSRSRKTLGFMAPSRKLSELLP